MGWFTGHYFLNKTVQAVAKVLPKLLNDMDPMTRLNVLAENPKLEEPQKARLQESIKEMQQLKSYFESRGLTLSQGIGTIVKDFMEMEGL